MLEVRRSKDMNYQDLAIFVMGFWMIVFSISLFRLRNRVYMVQGSKVPIGSDYGAVLGEKFPVTKFTTINGEPISLDSAEKNTVLLITSPGCDVCKTLYPHVRPFIQRHGQQYQVVSLMFGDQKEIEALQKRIQLPVPIVHISPEGLKLIKTERFPFGRTSPYDLRSVRTSA